MSTFRRADGTCVDDGLASLLYSINFKTRSDSIIDILATDSIGLLSDVGFDDVGWVSKLKFVYTNLMVWQPDNRDVVSLNMDIQNVVKRSFESALRQSPLFTSSAPTTNSFTNQLVNVIASWHNKLHNSRDVLSGSQSQSQWTKVLFPSGSGTSPRNSITQMITICHELVPRTSRSSTLFQTCLPPRFAI